MYNVHLKKLSSEALMIINIYLRKIIADSIFVEICPSF